MKDFTEYFNEFYGENGIYPVRNTTEKEIEGAIKKFSKNHKFEGDSVDREVIRDIIFTDKELEKAYK